jgi:predicted MFS family arabinose efflux permease
MTARLARLALERPALRRMPTMAWVLALTALINRMGAMAKLFMAIYLRESLHLPIDTIGWLLATYGAGTLVGSYGLGVVSDHLPPRRLAVGCLLASAVGLVVLSFTSAVPILVTLLFGCGVADAGYRPVVQRLIMEACPPEDRPKAQALHRVAINLGFGIGGLIGGVLAGIDYNWVFWSNAASSTLAASWLVYALKRLALPRAAPSHDVAVTPTGEEASPYRDRPFLLMLVAALPLAMIYDQVNGVFGNYLREYYGLTPAQVGWQHGLNGLMVALLQLPLTAWAQRHDVRAQALVGVVLMLVGFAMLPLGQGVVWALASTAIWSLGEMLWMPMLGVIVMQRAEGRRSGHYFGLHSAMWSGSALMAPVVGGQIYHHFGGHAVWYATVGAGLSGLLLLLPALAEMTRAQGGGRGRSRFTQAGSAG